MRIGAYIHYRYSNYKKHGLTVNENEKVSDVTGILDKQHKIFRKVLTNRGNSNKAKIKTSLENQLNFFFNPKEKNEQLKLNYTEEELSNLQQLIIDTFEEIIEEKGKDVSGINYNTLQAVGGGSVNISQGGEELSSNFANIRKVSMGMGDKQFTTFQALKRRLKELMALKKALADTANRSQVDNDFIMKMNDLSQRYQLLIKEVDQQGKGALSGSKAKKTKVFLDTSVVEKDGQINTYRNFAKELQSLIDMTKQATNLELQGFLGEYIPVITQTVLAEAVNNGVENIFDFSKDVIKKAVQSKVVGQQTSRKALNKNAVLTSKNNQHVTDAEFHVGDAKVKTGYTQDKVDILLQLPDDEIINASVKNVNLASGNNINILSGRSSLEFLQDYPTFANHYLNITANIGRDGDICRDGKLLEKAHNAMKMTIALHALTGGVWVQKKGSDALSKSEQAEIFLVNDVSKGRYSVYFMTDILNTLSENLNYLNIEEFEQIKQYDNNWVGDLGEKNITKAWNRVATILTQLHSQTLKVSISPEILTKV